MKNLSGKTLIFYTFQGKKQSEFYITSFKKSSPQIPKIRDVLFELPINYEQSSYHFRFKSQFSEGGQKITGWIDISNLLSKVPMIGNNIYVKILKIPSDNDNKLFTREKLTNIGIIDPFEQNKNGKKNQITQKSGQSLPHNPSKEKSNGTKKKIQNFFDDDETELKQNGTQTKTQPSTIIPSSQQQKKVPPQETTKQKLETFQQGFESQRKAREDQREASNELDQKITEWGFCGTKTLNNLTTLLATLHTLWPQWQPVSLTQLLKPQDVEAKFKKAKFMLHPDKNRNKDPKTKYLAKRLFEILNDSKRLQQ